MFLGIALSLFAAAASAQISSVSPSSFFVGSVEETLRIDGSGLAGNVSTSVTISGPAGVFVLDAPDATSETIFVSPDPALSTIGTYSVSVDAVDDNGTRHLTGGSFDVVSRGGSLDPPFIIVPDSMVVQAASSRGTNVTFSVFAFYQDGSTAPFSCNHQSGDLYPLGGTTVTCVALDTLGNPSNDPGSRGSFGIYVADLNAPVLTLPSRIFTTDPVVTYTATAVDDLDGSVPVTCSPQSGSTFPTGNTEVQCTARDSQNNVVNGSFLVSVGTVPPPSLTLPSNIVTEATGPNGATVSFSATSDPGATVVCSPASGSVFALGTTTVSCTATTPNAPETNGSFDVNVVDTTAPVLTVPADFTVTTTGSTAVVTFTATATDAVAVNPTVFCTPPSGDTFSVGITTVTCTTFDTFFNTTTRSFHVTVSNDQPPVLTLPGPITAEATSPGGAIVTFTATAVDDLDGVRPVTCMPASGSLFPLGTSNVICSASDTTGHTTTGYFTVTVQDTTAPHINAISANPANLWPPNHVMTAVTVTVAAFDAVDQSPVSHIVSVSSNQPINGTGDGDVAPDWQITGPLTLNLRAERAQGQVRIYTITVETSDFSGNVTTSTVDVTVASTRSRGVGH